MIISYFLAKLISPFMLAAGIGILLNRDNYQRMIVEFSKSPALIYLGGLFSLFFGLTIVLFHNVWIGGWQVVITIFGWAGIIKGTWLIIFPESASKMTEAWKKRSGLLTVHAIIVVLIGALLGYFGYLG